MTTQPPQAACSILFLLLLTLLSSPATASPDAVSSEALGGSTECPRIGWILTLLSSLVDFYTTDPDGINSDGHFGMSISQDMLRIVRLDETCPGHTALLRSVLNRQQMLDQRWKSRLGGKSRYDTATYGHICKPLGDIFRRLTGLLQFSRFELAPLPGTSGGSENLGDRMDIVKQLIDYNEEKGDSCLVQALRPEIDCGKQKTCSYLNRHLDHSYGYYLTHQLIYKIVLSMTTCSKTSADSAITPESIPQELSLMCSKALGEYQIIGNANWTAIGLLQGDEIVTGLRDLYIEQGLICGLLGITSFYNRQAVDRVASWQDPDTGCFMWLRHWSQQRQPSPNENSGFRRILRDVEMQGGCSSHSTGIAMGFYSNAIRFLAMH